MATKVKGGRGSKAKGSGYERELAAYLNERLGIGARRALLSGGGRNDGGADLDGTPLIHVEAKRTETFAPYKAMSQAEEAISKAVEKNIPVVINRRNNMPTGASLVVMRMDAWLDMYQAFLSTKGVAFDADKRNFLSMLDGSK